MPKRIIKADMQAIFDDVMKDFFRQNHYHIFIDKIDKINEKNR